MKVKEKLQKLKYHLCETFDVPGRRSCVKNSSHHGTALS